MSGTWGIGLVEPCDAVPLPDRHPSGLPGRVRGAGPGRPPVPPARPGAGYFSAAGSRNATRC